MGTVRRCDARCHDAKHSECRCWCGGRFHGAAGAQALRDFVAAWTEAVREGRERDTVIELPLGRD